MEKKIILELDRPEALATWEALSAARAFMHVTDGLDATSMANLERLTGVIGRLHAAIPDEAELEEGGE